MKILIVKIEFLDGTTDIQECFNIDDLSCVGVKTITVLREINVA